MRDCHKSHRKAGMQEWLKGRWLLLVALFAVLAALSGSYYLSHHPLIPCSCSLHAQLHSSDAHLP